MSNINKLRKRCAIYGRKSTSEPMEKKITSTEAQREACELYIHSQKYEGWELIKQQYIRSLAQPFAILSCREIHLSPQSHCKFYPVNTVIPAMTEIGWLWHFFGKDVMLAVDFVLAVWIAYQMARESE